MLHRLGVACAYLIWTPRLLYAWVTLRWSQWRWARRQARQGARPPESLAVWKKMDHLN